MMDSRRGVRRDRYRRVRGALRAGAVAACSGVHEACVVGERRAVSASGLPGRV